MAIEKEIVTPTGRTVVIRELTGREAARAYEYLSNDANQATAMLNVTVCSIRSVDGTPVVPMQDKLQYDATLDKFMSRDLDALIMAYIETSNEVTTDLKNEPAGATDAQ